MGNGRWDAGTWASYSSTTISGKSRRAIFRSSSMKDEYDPAKIKMRESRDSADNPQSTPIILAGDVTGSMGMVAEQLMRDGLNTLATEIYDRKPVTDPHIMMMAIGDAYYDRSPLQVTQFEADIRVAKQARELWLEGGGGGNSGESYLLPHLFAATKVSADAIEKRGRKGYLFTIGDEPVLDGATKEQIRKFLDIPAERDLTGKEILSMAQRNWDVYHIVLMNEGFASYRPDDVLRSWKALMPERTIELQSIDALAETVVSLIQVNEGAKTADVAASWSGSTAMVVADALKNLPATGANTGGVQFLD